MRYTFENGVDIRVEYIENEPGWSSEQVRQANTNALARVATQPTVLGYLQAPGLDLPGKRYAYASLRAPDLLHDESLTVDVRVVQSLADYTAVTFLNVEWIASDAWVLFLSASAALGKSDGDLTRLSRGNVIVGSRYSW
jgi:hypothetical protein